MKTYLVENLSRISSPSFKKKIIQARSEKEAALKSGFNMMTVSLFSKVDIFTSK